MYYFYCRCKSLPFILQESITQTRYYALLKCINVYNCCRYLNSRFPTVFKIFFIYPNNNSTLVQQFGRLFSIPNGCRWTKIQYCIKQHSTCMNMTRYNQKQNIIALHNIILNFFRSFFCRRRLLYSYWIYVLTEWCSQYYRWKMFISSFIFSEFISLIFLCISLFVLLSFEYYLKWRFKTRYLLYVVYTYRIDIANKQTYRCNY
jgi:hypothetical protein